MTPSTGTSSVAAISSSRPLTVVPMMATAASASPRNTRTLPSPTQLAARPLHHAVVHTPGGARGALAPTRVRSAGRCVAGDGRRAGTQRSTRKHAGGGGSADALPLGDARRCHSQEPAVKGAGRPTRPPRRRRPPPRALRGRSAHSATPPARLLTAQLLPSPPPPPPSSAQTRPVPVGPPQTGGGPLQILVGPRTLRRAALHNSKNGFSAVEWRGLHHRSHVPSQFSLCAGTSTLTHQGTGSVRLCARSRPDTTMNAFSQR